jgi:hypothetical protein
VVTLKINHKHRGSIIVGFLAITFFVTLLSPQIAPPAKCTYTAIAKPMEFYLHYSDIPVTVAGLQTKYVMDTTREFSFSTQQEARSNSLYKPPGLPKIVVDFYVYPNLAGPLTVDGNWQLFVWLNGSAYKPTSFSLSFREITVGGSVLWDSGQLNPTVTSSIGAYMDVPVYNYNLSVRLDHTFSVATTLLVECEVNAGSSADTRFWYDSELYPSKVILPAKDYARPISIKTYSIDNSETTLFHYNWTESWRKVVVRANITDPFGGYDLRTVNMTLLDPSGIPVLREEMTRVSDGQWHVNYQHLFEANWSYSTTAELGNYTIIVTVTDNNGYYRNLDSGSFEPFIEEETSTFTIGIIVYHDPTFLITDDADEPLPNAQVYITWRNGTTDTLPRYTSPDGSINLTQVSAGNYGFTILWKDATVAQTTVHVDSDGPYTIRTRVYHLTVQVCGNNGATIHGAYVVANTLAGVGFGLDTTNETGKAIFKLPSGTYRILVHYTSDYWLSVVRTTTSEQLSITTSTSETIVLADFPPAIWSTTLFWFLMILILAATTTIVLILYQRKRA